MMTDKERYVELKKRADSIKSRIDLRNGQRAVYISNLKNKGFNSIGEVEEYIKKAKIENDKITDRHIKKEKEEKEKNKAFIRTLQEASDIRLSFVDNLRRRLDEAPECYSFIKAQYNALKGKSVL